jgi:hypothetical protein
MDGGKVTSRIRDGLRRPGALLALSAAMIPAAVLWAGGDAEAETAPASSRYAVGSPGMLVAQEIARGTWGGEPCGGEVEVVWGSDEPLVNARSYWANPYSAYGRPELNTQCRVVFNAGLEFSWEKFCTVLVHEYGHLAGHPHGADGPDVMSPIYRAPLPACVAAPDPAAPDPVPAPAPAPTSRGGAVVDAPVRATSARRARAKARARARAAAKARARTRTATAAKLRARAGGDDALLRFSAADVDDLWRR